MLVKPKYHKVLLVPDIHAPFHDRTAIECLKAFKEWWEPNSIIFMGDLIDFYAISHFLKDPIRSQKLQFEIDSANEILDELCTDVDEKIYLRGNHEMRLQKYIWGRASELNLNSLTVPRLLNFDKRDIRYIDDGKFKYRGLLLKHGNIVRKFSGYTAKGEFEKNGISGASAHTHRLGLYYQTNESGENKWAELGCLCRMDADYLEGEIPNWQQGFGIVYFKEGSKRFHLELVPIINGKAMYAGSEFYQ